MFVFAIETNGKTVAFVQEDNRYMLDGFLNGKRTEGRKAREFVRGVEEASGTQIWDGVSPFTARLATLQEEIQFDDEASGIDESNRESFWVPAIRMIPPFAHAIAA
jgi:hypothetical protein